MKKSIVAACLFLFAALTLHADTTETVTPDPYGKTEFAPWQQDLRRAEIIAFGTLPFVTFLSSVGFEVYRYRLHNYEDGYKPWPIKDSKTAVDLTEQEQINILLISAGISVGSAIFDYAFRAVARAIKDSAIEKHNREIPDPIQIEPIPDGADERRSE